MSEREMVAGRAPNSAAEVRWFFNPVSRRLSRIQLLVGGQLLLLFAELVVAVRSACVASARGSAAPRIHGSRMRFTNCRRPAVTTCDGHNVFRQRLGIGVRRRGRALNSVTHAASRSVGV